MLKDTPRRKEGNVQGRKGSAPQRGGKSVRRSRERLSAHKLKGKITAEPRT